MFLRLIATLLLGSCAYSQDVVIAAAADLSPLEAPFRQALAARGLRARFTFGSSGMLARQIRSGAPFDVYLSANEQFAKELASEAILESVVDYARGRVGFAGVRSVEELTAPRVRVVSIPNPQHAPYGMAAVEALKKAGLWETIRPKVVYGENVRQAFEFFRSGNADAVLTAWTLVRGQGVRLEASTHPPLRQTGGIVKGRPNASAARRVLAYLTSPEGQALLARYGLDPAP